MYVGGVGRRDQREVFFIEPVLLEGKKENFECEKWPFESLCGKSKTLIISERCWNSFS